MANPIDPTSVDPPVGSIIKSDRTGRACYTAQYKQEVLDAFESSSLSGAAFLLPNRRRNLIKNNEEFTDRLLV